MFGKNMKKNANVDLCAIVCRYFFVSLIHVVFGSEVDN